MPRDDRATRRTLYAIASPERLLGRLTWPRTKRVLDRLGVVAGAPCLIGSEPTDPFAPLAEAAVIRFGLVRTPDPIDALGRVCRGVRRGGPIVLEDIDLTGAACRPASTAVDRWLEWHAAIIRREGGDPAIGLALPALLEAHGLTDVRMRVAQPARASGAAKWLPARILRRLRRDLIGAEIAGPAEIAATIAELEAFAADPQTVIVLPRLVLAWGRRPGGRRGSDDDHQRAA